MADSRFFTNAGAMTLQSMAALTGAAITSNGKVAPDGARLFSDIAPLDRAEATHVSFLDNTKYLDQFAASKAGACFVRAKFVSRAPEHMALLVTEQPYSCFALLSQKFYPEPAAETNISPLAQISKTATIGKNVRIDAFAVIGDGVVIGDGCRIGNNASISHALIGHHCIIHPGVRIGQDGFGFAPGPGGILKVPQLGRVVIGNHVEIGAGSCIDRGAGPDTIIGDFTKIDNLIQIGHNVRIGKFVMIAAQCGISGSTEIGDGVMLGGQVGVAGHIKIGAGAKIAAKAGVMADVPVGATYGGSPAVPIRDWHRQSVMMANLIRKEKG